MPRIALNKVRLEPNRLTGMGRWVRLSILSLFLAYSLLMAVRLGTGMPWFQNARWPDGVLLVLAAATTLASLSAQLPLQNVILASTIIAIFAAAAACLGALTGIPFGPFSFTPNIGQQLFYPLPWAVPVIWLVVLLNARGVARLMLRPWRKSKTYGFKLIGITVLLTVAFDLCLEPFASIVRHYWIWHPTKLPLAWYQAPLVNFFGWAVCTLLILAFATPSLINKQPVKFPPDFTPLIVWSTLTVLLLLGEATAHLWLAVAVVVVQGIAVLTFALKGAWW